MSNNKNIKECTAPKDYAKRCPYIVDGKCLNKRGCPHKGGKNDQARH